ncbi:M35 family metallo-endopeptidase [Pendulispora albinea]|uniref:M35 family metallo-endopeptidase n=1 Tax=Pendulispora albinea TaxID=2741071 RepID=A0ABZ2M8H1_9BACT
MNEHPRTRRFRSAIALAVLPVLAACSATSEPSSDDATLRATLSKQDGADVTVTLTNGTSEPARFLAWNTLATELGEPLFVLTRDGEPVAYQGRHYKRGLPRPSDYLVLAPGESLIRAVDLAQYYDMSQPGTYDIQYRAELAPAGARSADERAEVTSNHVSVQTAGYVSPLARRMTLQKSVQSSALAGTPSFAGCSSSQQTDVTNAFSSAGTYANQAVTYLNGTPSATTRYTTWFGAYSSSNWDVVKGHFANIQSAFDSKPFTFDCSTCTSNSFAYVYKDEPYTVYLCGSFWGAPRTGTDSKAGTIVHETSHFAVVADTDDNAYGQGDCKSLAKSSPSQARANADSHEYFAENNPALN